MQKLYLKQEFSNKLSLQQIQFVKLLQVSSVDMRSRINRELEDNPLLEQDNIEEEEDNILGNNSIESLDSISYRTNSNNYCKDNLLYSKQIVFSESLQDRLMNQLKFIKLDSRSYKICEHLVGCIDSDGYIRLSLDAISDDLAITQYLDVNVEELNKLLRIIQNFEPAGIGSQNLQECLLLQISRKEKKTANVFLAQKILKNCFKEFVYKHYNKIIEKLNIKNKESLKPALDLIKSLNPKPGRIFSELENTKFVYPEFIVTRREGDLKVLLAKEHIPNLRVRNNYKNLIANSNNTKNTEVESFIKNKLNSARWFIDAIKKRHKTLLHTMNAIVKLQSKFFEDEEEYNLRPMILKDIAEEINMDVSTISRVVSNKYVQTDFDIYPLKFFFSEGIKTIHGKEVSSKEVKEVLSDLIFNENKGNPFTDEQITKLLEKKGYKIARRTVAKYREQLKIPVTRLRKDIVLN